MAAEFLTLADLVKVNDMNIADVEITDIFQDAPLMANLAAMPSSNGTDHKYLVQDGAPSVGFRAPNAGVENKKSTDRLVTINLKIVDAGFDVDRALADAYKAGPEAYIAREARRHLRAAFFTAEKQIVNGGAGGFEGLADALDALTDAMVVSAGGTTANTGSSVYLVHTADDGSGCAVVAKEELDIKESFESTAVDASGNKFDTYRTPVYGWIGLQLGSAYDVLRIVNLTEDSAKGLTDDLLYDAAAKFPVGKRPNLVVMNRRSLNQLRKSRTAINATGAPAPLPEEVTGIGRIVVTDAILSTEALLA